MIFKSRDKDTKKDFDIDPFRQTNFSLNKIRIENGPSK